MLRLLALIFLFTLPQAADPTQPPATAHVRYTVDAIGVQVYRCSAEGNTAKWVFVEPQADLFDQATHEAVGTHTAGPTWTWKDNSSITGKVLQQSPSPDNGSIPWLLLAAQPNGEATGALSEVKFVRRSDTQGGTPATSICDATRLDETVKVPYKAVYMFYTTQ